MLTEFVCTEQFYAKVMNLDELRGYFPKAGSLRDFDPSFGVVELKAPYMVKVARHDGEKTVCEDEKFTHRYSVVVGAFPNGAANRVTIFAR